MINDQEVFKDIIETDTVLEKIPRSLKLSKESINALKDVSKETGMTANSILAFGVIMSRKFHKQYKQEKLENAKKIFTNYGKKS